MEQPFYHDDSFLSAYGHPDAALPDYKLLKQNMSVGFAEPYRNLKCLRSESDFYYRGRGLSETRLSGAGETHHPER